MCERVPCGTVMGVSRKGGAWGTLKNLIEKCAGALGKGNRSVKAGVFCKNKAVFVNFIYSIQY